MPTLNGSWQGSPFQARIYCIYSVTYTSDHTQAIYAVSFGIEFEGSVVDSTNSWHTGGDGTDENGTNLSYDIPSGGGKKTFNNVASFQKYGDASVNGSVTGIGAVGGGTISASFTLDSGDLAPYFTDSTYSASAITSVGCTVGTWGSTGNGGTLNNVQVQYNTSASATGATTVTHGSYVTSKALTGLTPNTTYYFRVRQSNNTYGYGAYGPWVSFKTASGLPGAPTEASWVVTGVTQVAAAISGNAVVDTGGSAITGWDAQWNTIADPTGATTYTNPVATIAGPMTGLLPGTLYYVRIRAKNANGYGAYSAWKSFSTLPGASVNVPTVGWKEAVPYVCISPGVWKVSERYNAIDNGSGGVNWK